MIQDAARSKLSRRIRFLVVLCGAVAAWTMSPALAADGLIRVKQPDRGTYQPPTLASGTQAENSRGSTLKSDVEQPPTVKLLPLKSPNKVQLVEAPLTVISPRSYRRESFDGLPEPVVLDDLRHDQSDVRQVEYQANPLPRIVGDQHAQQHIQQCSCPSCSSSAPMPPALAVPLTFAAPLNHSSEVYTGSEVYTEGEIYTDGVIYGDDYGVAACDGIGCSDGSCDGLGCGGGRGTGGSNDWFGSIELLLMFRKGDRLPPLVTTGPSTDAALAGRIDEADTEFLVGREKIFQDMAAGGRLTIGTWLDRYKDRSIVGRAWFAGEDDFSFRADQDNQAVLARPFFNVTDGQTADQDTQLIAFPDRSTGEISVNADTTTFGADISLRQLWYKRLGGTVDLLYGYQYMSMDQSLGIHSRSTSINDSFAPVGSVLRVSDTFDIENDFHGGQVGIATDYREGNWSFASLVKVGFGSLSRTATLTGNTTTSIDGNNAIDPNGLLVRASNAGVHEDNTFGWVPELDFTLGWHRYPSFDLTFGYHVIAMTDALEISGAIDPTLSVNFANTGVQRPSPAFRYDTFYVQGIHFGLSYVR